MSIAALVIGRNEGARLVACLDALQGQVDRIIYVDSGSTDGSVEAAETRGVDVVTLSSGTPFTAARARNAGLALLDGHKGYVQMLDGDCTVQPGWIPAARAALDADAKLGLVCGRRREKHPEASVYNRLADIEWDTPLGDAKACGGDALARIGALAEVRGFNPGLIAGEEPELCLRMRRAGWRISRLDVEMTLHDANLTRFQQWWTRSRRAGHAFAQGAHLHGASGEKHWVHETRRALVWGAVLPLVILGLSFVTPWALLGALIFPLQVLRLARRADAKGAEWATFTVLGKFAEAQGVIGFHLNRLRRRKSTLMEYK